MSLGERRDEPVEPAFAASQRSQRGSVQYGRQHGVWAALDEHVPVEGTNRLVEPDRLPEVFVPVLGVQRAAVDEFAGHRREERNIRRTWRDRREHVQQPVAEDVNLRRV